MGGRGSSYGAVFVDPMHESKNQGKSEELIVAGMTPTDRGSKYTNQKKTLRFIENKKRNYKKEQLQVLDSYGYVTRAFQGDEHSVGIDADTVKYMKGKIVTHNHPSSFGGTFSKADIHTLSSGMKELRASAKEGTYSMKAGKGADPEGMYRAYVSQEGQIQMDMRKIAHEMASRKWHSEEKYKKESRKAQLSVIDKWYQENAEKYGYTYSFEPKGKKP